MTAETQIKNQSFDLNFFLPWSTQLELQEQYFRRFVRIANDSKIAKGQTFFWRNKSVEHAKELQGSRTTSEVTDKTFDLRNDCSKNWWGNCFQTFFCQSYSSECRFDHFVSIAAFLHYKALKSNLCVQRAPILVLQ